ncbi:sulfurtransferase [Acidihalobacter prosperus]|uniref:3-mercaptopyruvate sulfurtransferase n=1 Tax=Acidihalobacter prosperus TaxID=160660 RepID=A0A1A6C3L3_9GAMM|nr:sulfurtransferase [Acidihalobacter prosperus]OBS09152.1 3-mercaptopyruvate sulfurtransferase [Acidihalobacter prosperus]
MSDCLIDTERLAQALDSAGDLVLVDCRFDLARPEAGREAYRAGHLPGAVYAHLDEDLSGPTGPQTGRHPLPDVEGFAARCGEWGIGPGVRVVAYDDAGGAYAARLWWLLRWLGHAEVSVLDGGLDAWRESGRPQQTDVPRPSPRSFTGHPVEAMTLEAQALQSALAARRCRLVDVRAAARFRGEIEPIDPVAGHVPGAVNHPFTQLLDARGRFLPAAELRAQFDALLDDHLPEALVAMCGSGVTACHLLLAMAHAGLPGGRLYPGSWSEWIRDPTRPVASQT